MADEETHEVTEILQKWRRGDKSAAEELFPLVYQELKHQAKYYLYQERPNHTLQPTALVHEAYLKLAGQTILTARDRHHFFAIASRLMRQILVDHARKYNAQKHGGTIQRFSLEDIDLSLEQSAADLLELNDALLKLEELDERKATVVDLRFFGGLKEKEIAEVLRVTEKTVRRDWQFAKIWLHRELSQ
jgi:RNA polymerase sigma-70 factor, ECF subfamily